VTTLGHRRRSQPAPPHVIFEALTQLRRAGARPWLFLHSDEQEPRVLQADPPSHVLWSSLWPERPERPERPDDTIRFRVRADGHGGSALEWELLSDGPEPDASTLVHLRRRLNELINRDLRLACGQ